MKNLSIRGMVSLALIFMLPCLVYGQCTKVGSDVRLTNNVWTSLNPSMVWTGSGFGASWTEITANSSIIYFANLDPSGTKIGDAVVASSMEGAGRPSLVWTGSEFGISWYESRNGNYDIYFARLDSYGNKIGSDVRVTADPSFSFNPSLVRTGNEYGVSWEDYRDGSGEIYFARLDPSGNKIGSDVRVTNDPSDSYDPTLAWTGNEYGVSWLDGRDGNYEIYFAALDSSGNKIGSDVRVTSDPSSSFSPSLIWTGSDYGVSWHDGRDGNYEIYFAALDSSGNTLGSDARVTGDPAYSTYPSLVWTGSECGVSWTDSRDGNYEIYFARLDPSGNKVGSDVRVTGEPSFSTYSSLVWTGSGYGVSWADFRDGNFEIYFAQVGCNQPPVADAGQDSQSECSSPDGALMTLDGSASTDPDSTPGTNDGIVLFGWFEHFGSPEEILLGTGEILDVTLTLGAHVITLRVTDSTGLTDTDEVIKTVVDSIAPKISVSMKPDTLWPPDHKMVAVEATVTAADICGIPSIILASVTSDEPDDAPGNGDGSTINDIQGTAVGTADLSFKLRAERSGSGDGRTYTVRYTATDPSGNSNSASSSVNVPHDKGNKKKR